MNKFKKYAWYPIALIPILIFYGLFFNYTVNIPINDDYAILDFLNKCISTDSLSEKLKLIFSQHNEHRIVYDRIWTIISYKLNGQVNFNQLAFIGNLSLIGIFIIFCKKTLSINKNAFYIVPISVLIFNISFYENMTFAMATLSNLTVFVFSLLCIHFLSKKAITQKNLFLAIGFFILATLTQASGLFLIPLGLAILAYKKEKKKLLIYGLVSLAVLALYFCGYYKPGNSPGLLSTLLDFKVRALLFSFAFLGNAFDYNLIFTNDLADSIGITTVIGFLFFVLYLYSIKTKYYKKNVFVFSVMSLIVLTAFVTGVTRCQLGLETSGASRYRINGVIFVIALYLWFLDTNTFKYRKATNILIGAFSLFYLLFFSIRQYEYLSYRQRQTLSGVLQYHSGDHTKLNGFEQDYYKKILIESQNKQTYILPAFESLQEFFPYAAPVPFKKTNENSEQLYISVDNIIKIKDGYLIEGWAFIDNQAPDYQKVSIGLKSPSETEPSYFTATQIPRFDLNPYFKKNYIEKAGFSARIKNQDIKAGENEIWIMVNVNDQVKLILTDKKLIK